MNILDVIILFLLGIGMIRGFAKGFVVEFFSLTALFAGIILCLKANPYLLDLLAKFSIQHWFLTWFTYLAFFLLIYGVIFYAGIILERLLKVTQLNLFNRLAGSLFGLLKAVFMLSLLLWISDHFSVIPKEVVEKSLSYHQISGFAPYILQKSGQLWPFLEGMVEQTEQYLEQILLEF